MLYDVHDLWRTMLGQAAHVAQSGAQMFAGPGGWLAHLPGAPGLAAGYELLHRLGKHYDKPVFGIDAVEVGGTMLPVVERAVLQRPFCRLLHFRRYSDKPKTVTALRRAPAVLVVAPLSGHHATLLRDTVRTLLRDHDVYVTDWVDARIVPIEQGPFSLDDYVRYLHEFIDHIGAERLHIVAVCQAAVPALAVVSLMATAGEAAPRSLTMMGGPIDPRRSPTSVNQLATTKPFEWFERHVIHRVPHRYAGRGRRVYPGFLQHFNFMAMNPVRHVSSHLDFFRHLVQGDLDDAEQHRRFYDEYNAVLDLAAEYYLDCIRIVFQEVQLPRGRWHIGNQRVAPEAIRDTAIFTIEGELDDISGIGQTSAAHDLCTNVPAEHKRMTIVEGTGHYGIFSGRRWRQTVYPQVREFIAAAEAWRTSTRR